MYKGMVLHQKQVVYLRKELLLASAGSLIMGGIQAVGITI
jgi:hypothetical protein